MKLITSWERVVEMNSKKIISILMIATMGMTVLGCGSSAHNDTANLNNTVEEIIEEPQTDEQNVEETELVSKTVDMGEYVFLTSMGDLDGNGIEDVITVELTEGVETFGEALGDVLNVWFNNEKIYEFNDIIAIYDVCDSFKYIDLDGDGKEEIFIAFEPMVNSMPLMEYLVLKNTDNGWSAINLENEEESFDEQGNVTNSFPINVKRTGKEPLFEISIDGYGVVASYDATQHYTELATDSEDFEYEHNVYISLLTGDENLSDYALEDGTSSAWGIWNVEVSEYEGQTCLKAEQGIQGPYGKFDGFGTLYIYYVFDGNGNTVILNAEFNE